MQLTTPHGWLASVAREECYRCFDSVLAPFPVPREYPPGAADFADAFELPVRKIVLEAKLEEARLKPANDARIKELMSQLAEMSNQ